MTSLIRDDGSPEPADSDPKRRDASRIRKLYDDGTRDIRNEQLTYEENSCFIEGQQWVYRSNTTETIRTLERRNPRRVQITDNRVGPESRRLFSKLLRRPLVFEVMPDSADDATIRGAKTAEAVLDHYKMSHKWERLREEAAWGMWKGGTSLLCVDWDASAGRYVGRTSSGRNMGEGDVRVTPLTIAEVATEPGTRDIERACWWIKALALPPAEVKKLYNLPKTPPANTSATMPPAQRSLQRYNRGGQSAPNLTLVLTYYERPSQDNPRGMVCTVVDEEVVDGPYDWPFPFKDRLNLVCMRETIVEGRWPGRTVVSDAIPVQMALNHATTSILEHLKQAGNARLMANSAEQNNLNTWTDEAGEFILYDTDPYEWLSPPAMPDWWQRVPDMLKSDLDDIIGIHDVSRGNAPTNIESGLGLSILAEQDDTPTGRLAAIMADGFGDMASLVLKTLEAKAQETRVATLRPDGAGNGEKLQWTGQSFMGQTNAIVPFDAVAPINEAARFARALELLNRGVIQNPSQLSAYIDLPGKSSFIESIEPNVSKARRENYRLAQGEPVEPATFDNHAMHIEEHNRYRLTAGYERLNDHDRMIVDLHIQAHSTLAAEEMGSQTMKGMMAPPLAAAAQADQPPGSAVPLPSPGEQQMGAPAVMGDMFGGNPDTSSPEPEVPGGFTQ